MKLTPFSTILKNGQSVLVREVTPDDRHLLEIGFEQLSDQSRCFRFLAARQRLTASELDMFTASNGPDHVAIGALVEDTDPPEPVGIARFVRLHDQDHVAEIALTLADSHHGQGLGSLLLGTLIKFAKIHKISEIYALVHSENRAMLDLLAQLGSARTLHDGADVEVRVSIGTDFAQHSPASASEAFKNAYRVATIQ